MKCIYCNNGTELTDSDIIPFALTGAKVHRKFVCHTHNAFTNDNFERITIRRFDMEYLQTDRTTIAVVEDAYHAAFTAKQDSFMVVGVYDSHESRQQELMSLVDVFLSDYFGLTNFWRFATRERSNK